MIMRVFYIYLVLFISVRLFGQTLELPKTIQSPNAASLGKYGDIPMNLSTGRANVNVPIYSLNDANIPLDISLNYDTGGVLVNDHPGWVGQNWSLNAGGVITRSMKGKNFDEFEGEGHMGYVHHGYLFNYNKLNILEWNTDAYLRNIAVNAATNENVDLEPDIFTFNFMGFNGRFFLGEDGEWKVASDSNFKVEIDLNNNVKPLGLNQVGYYMYNIGFPPIKSIGQIKLINADGNQYIFGGNMNSIEFNVNNFFEQSNRYMFASAWYLTKVLDKYNNEIYSLEYKRAGYQAAFYNAFGYTDYKASGGGPLDANCSETTYGGKVTAAGNLIVPSYLKKIKALRSNIVLDFNSSESTSLHYTSSESTLQNAFDQIFIPATNDNRNKILSKLFYIYHEMDGVTQDYPFEGFGNGFNLNSILNKLKWRKLDNISITGQQYSKNVNLTYDDNPSTRLKLESIKSSDAQDYEFSYIKFDALPKYLSQSVDHFGYFNGKDFSLSPDLHYKTRNSNRSTVQYGVINGIVYPTKGYSFFGYEAHRYSKAIHENFHIVNDNGYIGGLRINKKIDFDSNHKEIKNVDFQYTNALNTSESSGILVKKNVYSFPSWQVVTNAGTYYNAGTFSINSVIPLSNFSGSFIEYSKVIEREKNKGYTVHQFTNYDDSPNKIGVTLSIAHSIMDPITERGFMRGKLNAKSYYDENNILLQDEKYSYINNPMQKVRAFNYTNKALCSPSSGIVTGSAYEIYYSDFSLKEKLTTVYNGSQKTESKENFYHYLKDNFGDQFLREKTIKYPDDKTLIESYKYTFDSPLPQHTELSNKREYSIISAEHKLNNLPISKTEVEYAKVPIYDAKGSITSDQKILPVAYNTSKYGTALENEMVVDKYDKNGNILMAHAKDKFYYYYYAYNDKHPILKIEGTSFTINLDSKIENLINLCESSASINSQIINAQKEIRELLPTHQITAYTYFPNIGIETISPPTGIIEYYIYDNNYRLQAIKNSKNEIIKEFTYNYSTVNPLTGIFYNAEKRGNFTKNDCPNGQEGGDYEYIIPFGKHFSLLSQQDADNKASQDLLSNGQAEANFNETCDVTDCIWLSSFRNGVTVDKIGYRKVKVTIDLYFNNLSYDWNNGVIIAQLDLECAPAYRTFRYDIGTADPNAIWTVYVDVNGKMILKYDGDITQIPHYQMAFVFYAE